MNKRISTLMSGLLLTSVFASAANVVPGNLEKAKTALANGKSYFIVQDANGNGQWDSNELSLSAIKTGATVSFKGVVVGDEKNLTWTLGIQEYANPDGETYYYTLYNAETESYLAFKDDGSAAVAAEKGENKADARALFTAAQGYDDKTPYTNGGNLFAYKATTSNGNALTLGGSNVTLGGYCQQQDPLLRVQRKCTSRYGSRCENIERRKRR